MKRGRIATKPKQGKRALITQADGLIKQVTLARCGGKCEFPGCNRQATTNHHVIHCRNLALRWREENNMGICAYHHAWEGQADNCVEFGQGETEWAGGPAKMDALRLRAHQDESETPEQAIERLSGRANI
jgi:hypothetical protein